MTVMEFLTLIKNKWYIVLAIAALASIGTAIYSWTMLEDQYTASVDLYVLSKAGSAEDSQRTQSDMSASQQLANDIAVLASSAKVKKLTADALGIESLKGYKINVKSASTNRVITLSVVGYQPEATALVANELGAQLSKAASEIMELKAVNMIDEADTPSEPSGPKRLQYTALAFAIGIILAMDFFSVTFKSAEETEEALGLPVVGRLPKVKK